jgi:hypothetical protein
MPSVRDFHLYISINTNRTLRYCIINIKKNIITMHIVYDMNSIRACHIFNVKLILAHV